MHLPDGFLDAKTALLSYGIAAAGVSIALRQAQAALKPRGVPLLGLSSAFVFAAQMLNFPVLGGTSGHLTGGVLVAVLIGPSAAVLVMTCVLLVQCLMFSDGGLSALGANIFNMGILGVCGGYAAFRAARWLVNSEDIRATVFASVFAGWCGTVIASIGCSGQLALSGTAPWSFAFPAMVNIHMVIGVGEGLATGLIVLAVMRSRPGLVTEAGTQSRPERLVALSYGLVIAFGLAIFVAPFACPWPDGLEKVAESFGLLPRAAEQVITSPFAGYRIPWAASPAMATALAGCVGTGVAFVAAYVLARFLVPAFESDKKDATPGN
jgi:cobalt/nickel transport system permease protein